MELSDLYRVIPGKTGKDGQYLPLWLHLEDTAAAMDYLCMHRVPDSVRTASGMGEETFRRTAILLARIHDIGKCTPLFVARILPHIPDQKEKMERLGFSLTAAERFLYSDKSPHAFAGEVILTDRGIPNGICSVVGAHHGKPTSESDAASEDMQLVVYRQNYYAEQMDRWRTLQDEIIRKAMEKAGFSSADELPSLSNCAQMLLTGLLIQADWIASNDEYFPLLAAGEELEEKDVASRAETAWERLGLPNCWIPSETEKASKESFKDHFGFSPNPLQLCAVEAATFMSSGGLMIIEAQMGVGKTEAALAAAEILSKKAGCGGIFFGLPTQATSNGLFPRLTAWAEKLSEDDVHAVRLVHGMAELNDDYRQYFRGQSSIDDDGQSGLIAHRWFTGRKQALLADFVVGTVDTALMAALKQKHVMLRHLGLCGKTVIIDECHAYDAYMSRYLDRMLCWFGAYKIPVILLSATLPAQRRQKMLQAYLGMDTVPDTITEGYPVITWTELGKIRSATTAGAFSTRPVRIGTMEEDSIVCDLKDRLSHGGCAGVIVNTVKRAQAIFRQLKEAFPDKKVYVYHAQFLAEDRIGRENELIKMIGKQSTPETRDNVIIVGTQVLEQSLDIDFDYLITDLCPMDLLLQRIGRLHRHDRVRPDILKTPYCSVLCVGNEFEKGAEAIYCRWLLKQTKKYLPELVSIPEDIPRMVDLVYAEPEQDENDPDWIEFRDRTEIKEEKASSFLLGKPRASRREKGNSILGMLDRLLESEKTAEASVRDGLPSVEVLVMRKLDEDRVGFLPWVSDAVLRMDTVPSQEEGKAIARQHLRLPAAFCQIGRIEKTVEALEEENGRFFSQWQQSPWLKGELVFLLDSNGERDFGAYHIKYEQEIGFTYQRKE